MKTCAIVILNYNGVEMLKTFLPSVTTCSTFEIILIDNASSDESIAFIDDKYPDLQIIQLEQNLGYAGGYNKGLEGLKEQFEYYILLNSDVAVTPSWDQDLISWMQANPFYGALQPKILSYQVPSKFDYAGAGGGFLDYLGYPYCRGRIWNTIEQDQGQYDDAIQVDWASGACMVVNAADFHLLGGFDALFFAHMEEIDLCWRMRNIGKSIGYLGAVKVFHLGGATLDRASPRKLELNIRNNLYMLYKMLPTRHFFWRIVVKIFLEGMVALVYLLSGKKDFAKSVVIGHVRFWQTKNRIQKFESNCDEKIRTKSQASVRFLFWNYYILRRKLFSEL